MIHFTINEKLPGYNQLTQGHWAKRNELKQKYMDTIGWEIKKQRLEAIQGKAIVIIRCYESNKKRDPSNVRAGAEKLILDALQKCGIIRNDNSRWLIDVPATVEYDKIPRVEVEIKAVG